MYKPSDYTSLASPCSLPGVTALLCTLLESLGALLALKEGCPPLPPLGGGADVLRLQHLRGQLVGPAWDRRRRASWG